MKRTALKRREMGIAVAEALGLEDMVTDPRIARKPDVLSAVRSLYAHAVHRVERVLVNRHPYRTPEYTA